ncbi:DUF3311 domain-containing protein [Actinopolymorpha rutila]|uniref:Membrane protein implicated in regulation of membrane protease activity n=1 Tax=Actinopolymorpha rutila TaxID=446787 RepID=A0A852ZHC2_9ACTN|nr:DUF3311 domain-containing protein [Actinopolymorpha rutila]NYH88999.1 membrane protein implicated in regulation of membrane protease activity [Actinopolymorpha rutila]
MVAPAARGSTPLVTPTRVVVAVLLAAPFVGTLWVTSYARVEPRLGAFPFFYWYQILWIFMSALCTIAAYLLVRRENRRRGSTTSTMTAGDAGTATTPTDRTEGGTR